MENPKYLNCPWCSSQAFITSWVNADQVKYQCPAKHVFYIEQEDPSFYFGHNEKERES